MFNIKTKTKEAILGYLFILPAVIVISMFGLYPVIRLITMSFQEYNMLSGDDVGKFVGGMNYLKALKDEGFWNAFKNTIVFSLCIVPVQSLVALYTANLVNKKLKGVGVFRTIYYLPVIMSFVVVSIFWKIIYDPMFGLANSLLSFLGFDSQNFLSDPKQAMICVIIVCIWKSWGWYMLIFLSGLQGIPHEVYEAAAIDGASKFETNVFITLPLLSKTILFVLVITTMDSLKIYTPVYVMTGGGPLGKTDVAVYHIWQEAFRFNNMGYASALSIFLFIVILVVTVVQLKIEKSDY